jgi:hypothetical protein
MQDETTTMDLDDVELPPQLHGLAERIATIEDDAARAAAIAAALTIGHATVAAEEIARGAGQLATAQVAGIPGRTDAEVADASADMALDIYKAATDLQRRLELLAEPVALGELRAAVSTTKGATLTFCVTEEEAQDLLTALTHAPAGMHSHAWERTKARIGVLRTTLAGQLRRN